ncbi:hypothetical protein ACFC3F_06800 [Microbacterium sp. NPDC055910]|uniref:hypothetical protein n=1 Tax=Microbacterium sp. NPDC055910 TaxID=3345659 RepID=UPI0035D64DA2
MDDRSIPREPGPEPDTTDAAEPDDTDARLEPEDAPAILDEEGQSVDSVEI